MKTKFYALLASAALIVPAQAGSHQGGGGGGSGSGGHVAAAGPGPARGGSGSSFRGGSVRNFGGSRMMYSGQRFSSIGGRSPSSSAFRQQYIRSNRGASIRAREFTPRDINRGTVVTRFSNRGNQTVTNPSSERTGGIRNQNGRDRLTRLGNSPRTARSGSGGNSQLRHGNNLPSNWRNHVVAQRSANWQRNWDRRRDHTWRGHHCRFINGSWVIFDFGFYPWWPYWYPYDYYAYDYYPYSYSYDPGYYDSGVYQGEEYYNQNGYDSGVYQGEEYNDQNDYDTSDQSIDSTVAAVQDRLAQKGYYRGRIDNVLGPATRRAITRYQSKHGLRVTGYLTNETIQALGLGRIASY
jgi:hypothetical protein